MGKEEWVERGTALLLSICYCPPTRLPSSASMKEGPLSEEQEGSPGERVLATRSLPRVVQVTAQVHISACVY